MKYLSILMVGFTLLLGGCVQLQQPLVNGGSKLGTNREISIHELELREGVWYAKGETEAFNGTAIRYREDGSKYYERPTVDGKTHGTVIWYFKDGSTKTSEWVHGTGTALSYHDEGSKRSETPYLGGKRHGTQIVYYPDGMKLQETPFVNGKMHGKVISYHEDGSKQSEGPYINDKIHGTMIWYNQEGRKLEEMVYEHGNRVSRKKF